MKACMSRLLFADIGRLVVVESVCDGDLGKGASGDMVAVRKVLGLRCGVFPLV